MAIEWLGENSPDKSEPTILDHITGLEYDGWPLREMTRECLYNQGKVGGIINYVWPHEGYLTKSGAWRFHKGPIIDGDTRVDPPTKPLLVDAASARAFALVWDAINETNRERTEGLLKSRGMTVWLFEKLIWPNVSFGGA